MRDKTYHIILNSPERKLLIHSLVELKKSAHSVRQIYGLCR